jgi:hypothetical protein
MQLTGLGNAVVAQLIHVLNDYYCDWRDTTLFLSGILFTIVGFGALFRPVEFSFQRKTKTYHHTMNDTRLPPSCMTSVEKLQRFVYEMDKLCASHQSGSISISNHEANDFDGLDSYSADDIKELEDEFNENTYREKMPMSRFRRLLRSQTTNDKLSLTPEKQLLEIYYQPISQKDIFYRGNVPGKSSSLSQTSCPNLIQFYVYQEPAASPDNDSDLMHSLFYRKCLSFLHTLRRMLGLQLFRDYRYVIFFLSQFLFYFFFDLIYLFPGKFYF